MNINRRDCIKLVSVVVAGQAVVGLSSSLPVGSDSGSAAPRDARNTAVKWGMLIDLEKCIGCQSCTMACKEENGTPRGIDWNIVRNLAEDRYPNTTGAFLPLPCMHCEKAACVEVCPVQATYKREDGLVMQNYQRCIGCRYCQVACPYGRRYFNWQEPDNSRANPAVERRMRGVIEKCTFCVHRIDAGVKNGKVPGRDAEATPACVNICPMGARVFGDLNQIRSTLAQRIGEKKAKPLKEYLGTAPAVYYVAPRGRRAGLKRGGLVS